MRKYFSAALLLLIATHVKAQSPQLTVDGKTNNGVQLQSLQIEIKVCGTVARTTWQMTFRNTTSKILEGNLNFPLKDGMSVSRYALDINGKMREAVPVDRSKGTEVFETIERRRVDPGLLEKVDGNTFRTRIYPINPNSTRIVLIGYEEELPLTANNALQYYLPLNMKDTIGDFSMTVSVIQSATQPFFDSSLNENLQFSNGKNVYNAAVHKTNYVPDHSLAFSIPKPADAAEVMLQEFENKYYFLINTRIQKEDREKTLPGTVGLLWDASLSGINRNIKNEMALLDAYFKKLNTVTVTLVVFSNTIKNTATYQVQNGNWETIKKAIETIPYDGATNLENLNLKKIKADEFILVSDGLQTTGNKAIALSNQPVYCINSATAADFSRLKFITLKTGGAVIDLLHETVPEALKKITNEPFRFLGIKPNTLVKEHYPSLAVQANNNFALTGIADEAVQEIVLQFGYGNTVSSEKTITINAAAQLCENFELTKVFAQNKIAELDIQYQEHKQEIERVGRQFGIVTRNTSLIVLETVSDYIQYQIEPPAELMEEYNRIMKQRGGDIITKKQQDLQRSLSMMGILKEWYNKKNDLIKKEPVAVVNPVPVPTPPASVASPEQGGNNKTITGQVTDTDDNPIPFATIKIRGVARGAQADASGNYRITVKKNDVLQYSAIGFATNEKHVRNATVINCELEKASTDLNEVVVIGYGTRKRTAVTGSVQTVSEDEINTVQQPNVNTALQGRVAGVQIQSQPAASPGSGETIRIRGTSSVAAGSEPLYVVDGVAVSGSSAVHWADVKEINVLKNADAAGLFGSRASNGVIIITTKNFLPDSSYKNIQDKITSANNISNPPIPGFDIETFDYIAAIKQTEKASRYSKYLELRPFYNNRPTYYFTVATYLLKTGDTTNGLTILSNLAEMENSNYELYKMLGYKLKEAGAYEDELAAFKKVMELRPADPQSYRDCALAYEDLGNHQQALELLYEGMTKSYSDDMNRMYNGIEEIFLTEINRIIALHKKELDLKNIDKNIITPMPTDIRVVMNWNKNNTDIDLWVTDPDDEKCFYSHKTTAIGGRISDDFTEGFGPEQFILKTGIRGRYKIQINYYGDRQMTITGPTTIMAEIYVHYGTPSEEKKVITLQMEKGKQGEVFIGEVEL